MALTSDHLFLARTCLGIYTAPLDVENANYFESPETGCQGYVFRDESRIVVCFRGSDSLTDWRMNFSMSLIKYPCTSDRMVHQGFLVCKQREMGLELVTFGSPRVGNLEFKKDIESNIEKCTRIVLDRDVVTQAPLSLLGYEHVGKTIQIRDDTIVEKEPTWLESLHWILLGLPYVDLGVRDHMPWNYVNEISRWLQDSNSTAR